MSDSTSFHPPTIYAEELSNLRHGIPLWSPQPDHQSGNFKLGDVGAIVNGNFIKLFNAVEGRGHASQDDPFPDDFEPLVFPPRLTKKDEQYLSAGHHGYMHTDGKGGGLDLAAAVAPGASLGGGFHIDAQKAVGASVQLADPAQSEIVAGSQHFQDYVKKNHSSWVKLAKAYGIACKSEDIVISRGWVKATNWTVTSFKSSYRTAAAGVQANAAAFAGVGVRIALASGIPCLQESKHGPERDPFSTPDPPPCDQCIFLPVYKVRYRRLPLLPPKIQAGAGPHQLPPGDHDDAGGAAMQVIADPEDQSYHGPLDIALDYMLRRHEEAEMAIACEEDLNEMLGGDAWPDDLATYFTTHFPEVAYDSETRTVSLSMERVVQGGRTRAIAHAHEAAQVAAPEGEGANEGDDGADGGDGGGDRPRLYPLGDGQIQLGRRPPGGPPMKWPHVSMTDSAAEGSAVTTMAISPDGTHIATGMDDAVVRVWTYRSGTLGKKYNGHEDTPWSLSYSPDGRLLASGAADYKVIVWDTQNEQNPQLFVLTGHDSDVWSVAFSPDGKRLASGSTDSTVRIWDVATGTQIRSFATDASSVMQILWTPDGARIVSCAETGGRCWSVEEGQEIASFTGHSSAIWTMAVSPAGDRLITGSEDHTARIWDISTGEELVAVNEHTGTIWSVAFSPDGEEVVTGGYDKKVVVSNSFDGTPKHVWMKEGGDEDAIIDSVTFSRAGDLVVSGGADGSVRVYDNRNGNFVAEYQGHTDKIKSVHFSYDDNDILSSSDDGSVRVWNVVDALRL